MIPQRQQNYFDVLLQFPLKFFAPSTFSPPVTVFTRRKKISLTALHQNHNGKVGICFRIDVPFRLLTSPHVESGPEKFHLMSSSTVSHWSQA